MLQTQPDPRKSNKRSSDRPSSSGMLIFIAAFLGCILLFAVGAVIWWQVTDPEIPFLSLLTNPADPEDPANDPLTSPLDITPTVEDRFTMAVFLTDDAGILQTATVMRVEPDTGYFAIVGMPGELGITNVEYDTLARRLAFDGPESALMALGTYFGGSIDYHVTLSYTDVHTLIQSHGSNLIMNLPKAVDQQAADGSFSIHLAAGQQALTPKQTANLLRCDNWQGGRRERAYVHATVIEAYLNQFISASRDIEDDYATLTKIASTNLSSARFNLIKQPLMHMAAHNTGDIVDLMPAAGDFTGSGQELRFTPDEATYQNVSALVQ